MRPKIFTLYLVIWMTLLCGGSLAAATNMPAKDTPKYTDKETALELAKILDKGTFGRYTISSAYVQNDNISDYYISVILSDGSAQKWYIDQIYAWARDDKLELGGNRALLFLDPMDSRFVVLDKNKFHRTALNANIFVKIFEGNDPLEGQMFRFYIKNFSLIAPTETAFGRDENGSKYRYIIDLYNGMQELLTYEDAYRLIENNYLLNETSESAPTYKHAYHVTKIVPYPKGEAVDGVSQFGIEVQFDQPVTMSGKNFPYVMYEYKRFDKNQNRDMFDYVLDITIPNSEKKYEIRPIENLEYLHQIKIVADPNHPKRLLLRTMFNPTVMDIPPVVYKNSENSIYVNFFNLVDQTVLSRGMLLEAKKRKEAENASEKTIKITKAIKEDSDFGRAYIVALETQKASETIEDTIERIGKLEVGIKQFEEAALYAEQDAQLYNALAKRNELREIVVTLSLEYIKSNLVKEDIGSAEIERMISLLDRSESYTAKATAIKEIDELREKLNILR